MENLRRDVFRRNYDLLKQIAPDIITGDDLSKGICNYCLRHDYTDGLMQFIEISVNENGFLFPNRIDIRECYNSCIHDPDEESFSYTDICVFIDQQNEIARVVAFKSFMTDEWFYFDDKLNAGSEEKTDNEKTSNDHLTLFLVALLSRINQSTEDYFKKCNDGCYE